MVNHCFLQLRERGQRSLFEVGSTHSETVDLAFQAEEVWSSLVWNFTILSRCTQFHAEVFVTGKCDKSDQCGFPAAAEADKVFTAIILGGTVLVLTCSYDN